MGIYFFTIFISFDLSQKNYLAEQWLLNIKTVNVIRLIDLESIILLRKHASRGALYNMLGEKTNTNPASYISVLYFKSCPVWLGR